MKSDRGDFHLPLHFALALVFIRYSTDYGMFHFCIADSEHDWREGSEQYRFVEHCLASADRQKQPWLIFAAHRVLGYSSGSYYGIEGSFAEPMGRESLQKLWQRYKVDIAFYGHVHNYERTCPMYQVCMNVWNQHLWFADAHYPISNLVRIRIMGHTTSICGLQMLPGLYIWYSYVI